MLREEYLSSNNVKKFIKWIEVYLDEKGSFLHEYTTGRPKLDFKCDSIYSAYENYGWNFSYINENATKISGFTYIESEKALHVMGNRIREGLDENSTVKCRNACIQVLQWGGVTNKNQDVIIKMGDELTSYLKMVSDRFKADLNLEEYYIPGIHMNSGFTKIYSLILDDYVIYDSRVGAALCLLVRKFCEKMELEKVPDELKFAWAMARTTKYSPKITNMRYPGSSKYDFPALSNKPEMHTYYNIKANWLLKSIIDNTESKFNDLDKNKQLRALESALFMIGYSVNKNI